VKQQDPELIKEARGEIEELDIKHLWEHKQTQSPHSIPVLIKRAN
jgi:hypothetical protein